MKRLRPRKFKPSQSKFKQLKMVELEDYFIQDWGNFRHPNQ